MNKQTWLDIKRNNNYPVQLFYEFFKTYNTGRDMEFDEFSVYFQRYVIAVRKLPLKDVIPYQDSKLSITKLFDKKGILIKEY